METSLAPAIARENWLRTELDIIAFPLPLWPGRVASRLRTGTRLATLWKERTDSTTHPKKV
jgi:hypothetical protein